jgi:hypothetical protein
MVAGPDLTGLALSVAHPHIKASASREEERYPSGKREPGLNILEFRYSLAVPRRQLNLNMTVIIL